IRAPVVASGTKPPLVILAGAGAVVGDLVVENVRCGHDADDKSHGAAAPRQPQPSACRRATSALARETPRLLSHRLGLHPKDDRPRTCVHGPIHASPAWQLGCPHPPAPEAPVSI